MPGCFDKARVLMADVNWGGQWRGEPVAHRHDGGDLGGERGDGGLTLLRGDLAVIRRHALSKAPRSW